MVDHDVPVQALVADRAAMPALPPVVGTTVTTRLGRDYYVNSGGKCLLGAPGDDPAG